MNRPPPEDAARERDLPAAYVDGDPDAVRELAPREPSETAWDAAREQIHARLGSSFAHVTRGRRWRIVLAVGAAMTATAAAVAWVVIHFSAPANAPVPEVADVKPAVPAPVAPAPHEADPLAGLAVLPIASDDDVVLHRVPGDGWLPVGADPLPSAISLATTDEVEVDDLNPAWPNVTLSPGDAPMIFATKPR